ncbi:YfcC family protein [Aquisalibacillus elongatus]|uniref:Putative ion transporter superfamily protein YfcC n=1 Tax=Aquisalibacillus elongatus TaxID=485577 RepID=A0A3N5C1V4_9BACI|nr:TIGR00366 family protein [Aquisalibacillus elongatus]RPF53352.1 putative ion transporter superfamily protein YfcC [Aquisalibacillus elongatus]
MSSNERVKKRKFAAPHAFVIIFGLVVFLALLTYVIPAGEYERTTNDQGQTVVVDGTYQQVESNPTGFLELFNSIHLGMLEGAAIIFFIFIVGGSFNIFKETNTIEAAFGSISGRFEGKEIWIIPITMIFFSIAGASFGMFEEALPFIMIMVPLLIKLGFDSMVGTAAVLVGVSSGFTAAFMNPFTLGVAQGIADVPLFSGLSVRVVFYIAFTLVSILYVVHYARKIKQDPTKSLTYEEDSQRDLNVELEQTSMNLGQKLTMVVLGLTLVTLAYGVIEFGWYMTEIAGIFLIFGLLVGAINKWSPNRIAESFVRGCSDLVVGALVVGLAYAALVVLQNSNTIDTILYGVTNVVSEMPGMLAALGMYLTQGVLNFIVTSGSGQAALSMPIMTPLSDLVGVDRQTAVLAFQMGDGISNIFAPTSGLLLAALAMAKISWWKWFKWIWPLILIHYALGAIFVTIAHLFIWTS